MNIDNIVMEAFHDELQKIAVPVLPLMMAGMYAMEGLGKVKEVGKKTKPTGVVGAGINPLKYPEF